MRLLHILVTCEHGGHRIPPEFAQWFDGREETLESHRGHDIGALTMAHELAAAFDAPLVCSTTSRLLVDLNRSRRHPRLHSEWIAAAPESVRKAIVARYYLPYRSDVEARVAQAVESGATVLHLSSHSFTPVWAGATRRCDVGLLFDPRRAPESRLCRAWQQALRGADAALFVRRNYPYRGTADGLTTALRRRFGSEDYLGVEIEVNQRFPYEGGAVWTRLRTLLTGTLKEAVEAFLAARGERPPTARGLRSGASSSPSRSSRSRP